MHNTSNAACNIATLQCCTLLHLNTVAAWRYFATLYATMQETKSQYWNSMKYCNTLQWSTLLHLRTIVAWCDFATLCAKLEEKTLQHCSAVYTIPTTCNVTENIAHMYISTYDAILGWTGVDKLCNLTIAWLLCNCHLNLLGMVAHNPLCAKLHFVSKSIPSYFMHTSPAKKTFLSTS